MRYSLKRMEKNPGKGAALVHLDLSTEFYRIDYVYLGSDLEVSGLGPNFCYVQCHRAIIKVNVFSLPFQINRSVR